MLSLHHLSTYASHSQSYPKQSFRTPSTFFQRHLVIIMLSPQINNKVTKFFCKAYRSHFFTDGWNSKSHPFKKMEYGKWELHIPPNADGSCALKHDSRVQIIVNDHLFRISPWASYVKPFEGFTYQQFIYKPDQASYRPFPRLVILLFFYDISRW